MNQRRKIIMAGVASALAAPLASYAQQPDKIARVAFLALPNRATAFDPLFSGAFPLGMRDLGYVEGRNLLIEWRFADSQVERLPALAAELLQWKPHVLVAATHEAALAAQKATSTTPIVMATANDPVAGGLIQSLARPGGNITGLSNLSGDLGPKRLEMLAAMVPRLASVAMLSGGSIARIGNAGGAALNTTVMPFILRGVSLIGIAGYPAGMREALWERIWRHMRPRHLRDYTGVIGLGELAASLERMLARQTHGRILVAPGA